MPNSAVASCRAPPAAETVRARADSTSVREGRRKRTSTAPRSYKHRRSTMFRSPEASMYRRAAVSAMGRSGLQDLRWFKHVSQPSGEVRQKSLQRILIPRLALVLEMPGRSRKRGRYRAGVLSGQSLQGSLRLRCFAQVRDQLRVGAAVRQRPEVPFEFESRSGVSDESPAVAGHQYATVRRAVQRHHQRGPRQYRRRSAPGFGCSSGPAQDSWLLVLHIVEPSVQSAALEPDRQPRFAGRFHVWQCRPAISYAVTS